MARVVGSKAYEAKLAKFQSRVEPPPRAVAPKRVRPPEPRAGDPHHLARQRASMALLRKRIEFWTGLLPDEWSALPVRVRRTVTAAIRDYYEEIAEPRSPHGGMYGAIAEVYGGLPWVDWAHDGRGVIDDGY